MKKITAQRRSFPLIWVWVIFLVILTIGFSLYEVFVPCKSDFVIVECVFTKVYRDLSLFESAIVYLIFGSMYKFWKTRRHKEVRVWEYLLIGIITFLWVFGPLLFNNYALSILSFPILYLNLHLTVGPLGALLSQMLH